ncbi:hypothetical protein [Paraburkholderia bannensis]|uniref:hypothetical protein n=1 Tax=Paraburkholderia bannensis TaxID=765414 RepID=UPI002AB79C3A|nr:hypothetical protein [Paraburkholderia bannensis]
MSPTNDRYEASHRSAPEQQAASRFVRDLQTAGELSNLEEYSAATALFDELWSTLTTQKSRQLMKQLIAMIDTYESRVTKTYPLL